jgi:hypothetical protein
MSSTDNAPEKKKITGIELMMVIALIAVITTIAFQFDSLDRRGPVLRSRAEHLAATSAVLPDNKTVVDAYVACWNDRSISPSPKCALDAVALGRSQGRTEEGVSEMIGSMGIFENGCEDSDPRNLISVMKNEELLTLMGTWCFNHSPKKSS